MSDFFDQPSSSVHFSTNDRVDRFVFAARAKVVFLDDEDTRRRPLFVSARAGVAGLRQVALRVGRD